MSSMINWAIRLCVAGSILFGIAVYAGAIDRIYVSGELVRTQPQSTEHRSGPEHFRKQVDTARIVRPASFDTVISN